MRVLPWLLAPHVPLRVALPFVRGVVELAVEAAIVVGWPLGWALAAQRFAERGESRAMMLLGESPLRSAAALGRSAVPAVVVLGLASAMGAADASAPGRMAQQLVDEGRAACEHATTPSTYAVPFVSATWLCTPGAAPRLYGSGPGALHNVTFTARNARIGPDMRRIELDDARLRLRSTDVRAGLVVLHGMAPWTHASNVPPWLRVLVVELAAALAGALALVAGLMSIARTSLTAVAVGVSGPLATLGLMRALERADAPGAWYLVTPIVALLAVAALVCLLGWRRIDGLR